MTAPIDLRRRARGRALRYTSCIDGDTIAFERALLARTTLLRDDGTHEGTPVAFALPLEQRHAWLRSEATPFRLFQMCDAEGRPAMQAVVRALRGEGVVANMGCAVDGHEEREGLALLRDACTHAGDLASLTVRPLRVGATALRAFERRARSAGFDAAPDAPRPRARLLALGDRDDDFAAALPLGIARAVAASDAAVRPLVSREDLAAARALSDANAPATWPTLARVARARPDLLRVAGVYSPGRGRLVACAAAQRHGALVEIVHAAVHADADGDGARVPSAALLLWSIARWARDGGAARVVARGLEGVGVEVEAGLAATTPLGEAEALSRATRT